MEMSFFSSTTDKVVHRVKDNDGTHSRRCHADKVSGFLPTITLNTC